MCKNCDLWVNDDIKIGDYTHASAVEGNKGFCLIQDLFTYTEAEHSCDYFVEEKAGE